MLLVINSWGQGNVAADVTDNGTVNTDDLLTVLNHWGYCVSLIFNGPTSGGGEDDIYEGILACLDSCGDDIECFTQCLDELLGSP